MKARLSFLVIIALAALLFASIIGCRDGEGEYQLGYAQGWHDCKAANNTDNDIPFSPIIITGSGDQTSPPFEVTSSEWLVEWSYTADEPEGVVFLILIYPRGKTENSVESIWPRPNSVTSGSKYSYAGEGEYYLEVLALNIDSWEVVISPPPEVTQ